ncbi:hypothetical protein KSW90_01545 [Prevotella copri]|uniref:Uncharacterized protein n=1 Tax=Segatella copri TaxID=165179 RepID=A0AAW4N6G2_9BACT|nr:hypothetical protein [Segatella copri]MBU9910426.1 hypothetical protein [Segatella copri]MBV3398320.1 hypothetical protein [Segatella copri]MBV3407894.1 hypothetical protein [Segatella copri]MBV3410695.1 hypothetical protein [Segatella copri]MBV3419128.1 hypothetical protein [Segatella copri]
MAKKNIDLAVVLHDDCDYKDWLVELKERFYSHRLKASCATNGYFYKLYAPLQANCPQAADDFKLLFLIPWDHHRRIIDKCKGNGATDNQRPFNAHLHAYVVYKKIYGMQAAVVLNLMHKGKDLLALMK